MVMMMLSKFSRIGQAFLRLGCIFWEGDEDCDRGEKMENTYAFWSNLVGLTGWLPREAAAETQISHPSLSIG